MAEEKVLLLGLPLAFFPAPASTQRPQNGAKQALLASDLLRSRLWMYDGVYLAARGPQLDGQVRHWQH